MNHVALTAALVMVTPMGLFVCWLYFLRIRYHKGRIAAFERSDIARLPGHSLAEQVDHASLDVGFEVALMECLAGLLAVIVVSQPLVGLGPTIVGAMIVTPYLLWRIHLLGRMALNRGRLIRARDAEQAVGHALNQLMRDGCRVVHDVPADKFNIDHVLISPHGVYAVETKSRRKVLTKKNGKETKQYRVKVTRHGLEFPGWTDTTSIAQAERQAAWLHHMLSVACGFEVKVAPVLIIPGWYVERPTKTPTPVLSHKEAMNLFSYKPLATLSPEQIAAIEYQLLQKQRQAIEKS